MGFWIWKIHAHAILVFITDGNKPNPASCRNVLTKTFCLFSSAHPLLLGSLSKREMLAIIWSSWNTHYGIALKHVLSDLIPCDLLLLGRKAHWVHGLSWLTWTSTKHRSRISIVGLNCLIMRPGSYNFLGQIAKQSLTCFVKGECCIFPSTV